MCDGLEAVQCDVGLQALSSRHPQVSQRPDYYLTSALEPEVQPATGLEVLASSDLESAEKVISYVQLQEFLGQHYGLEPSEQSPKYKRSCGIKVVIICFVVLAFALGVAGSFMVNQMIHARYAVFAPFDKPPRHLCWFSWSAVALEVPPRFLQRH